MKAFLLSIFAALLVFLKYSFQPFSSPFLLLFIGGEILFLVFLLKKSQKIPFFIPQILIFIFILFCFIFYLNLLPSKSHPSVLSNPQIGIIEDISLKPTQWRITLKTQNNGKILAIFYPKTAVQFLDQTVIKINLLPKKQFTGRVVSIKKTKTQVQFSIITNKDKVLGVFYKSKKALLLPSIHLDDTILIKSFKQRTFTPLDSHKRGEKTKVKKGYTYFGRIGSIQKLSPSSSFISHKEIPKEISSNNKKENDLRIGQKIEIIPVAFLKPVQFLVYPKYLFAQNYSYYGRIQSFTIINSIPSLSLIQKTKEHLFQFYKNSLFSSFYNAVFIAKKNMDQSIYNLFRKNDVVPFLVISGLHIDIIISFLLFFVSALFILPSLWKKNPLKSFKNKEIHFFDIRHKSFPLFMAISILLTFYLLLLDFPQSATRAVLMFFFVGGFYHLGYKTTRLSLLFLCVLAIILLFPQWTSYPLGFIYSTLCVFAIYFTMPLVYKIIPSHLGRVSTFLFQSLLLGFFISIFIIPLSLFMFHYYNLLSIIINIPLSLLFFLFVYVGVLASFFSFIFPFMGLFSLKIGDFLIQIMLELLKLSSHVRVLVIYIHHPPNLIELLLIYLILFLGIYTFKRLIKVKDFIA